MSRGAPQLLLLLAVTALGATGILLAIYLWMLPILFHGFRTPYILYAGALTGGGLGCWLAYSGLFVRPLVLRIALSLVSGTVVAALVSFCFLLIMANTVGE